MQKARCGKHNKSSWCSFNLRSLPRLNSPEFFSKDAHSRDLPRETSLSLEMSGLPRDSSVRRCRGKHGLGKADRTRFPVQICLFTCLYNYMSTFDTGTPRPCRRIGCALLCLDVLSTWRPHRSCNLATAGCRMPAENTGRQKWRRYTKMLPVPELVPR